MKKKKKVNFVIIFFFILGLLMYLSGLFMLLSSSLKKASILKAFFPNLIVTNEVITKVKILGSILFLVGFLLFLIVLILLYKDDKIQDNSLNLIVEGKADVITIIIMTYVMIFMLVICLIFAEYVGALLFGITIVTQTIVNSVLIKLYNKSYRRK